MRKYLVVDEVAQILRVSDMTVRSWARQGVLPSIRVGRKVLFNEAELGKFIDGLRASADS